MHRVFRVAVWLCLGLTAASLAAQEAEAPAEAPVAGKKSDEKNLKFLPSPLSAVQGNVLSLENTGYFRIEDVDFRARPDLDSVVWKVRMKKPATCRHIEAMLREYRDVRFYETVSQRPIEILTGLLYYSQRVSLGSASNLMLGQDDVFEVWIDLTDTEVRKLRAQRADRLVLRRWRY